MNSLHTGIAGAEGWRDDDEWDDTKSGRLFTDAISAAMDPGWISQKFKRFIERHATIRQRYLVEG